MSVLGELCARVERRRSNCIVVVVLFIVARTLAGANDWPSNTRKVPSFQQQVTFFSSKSCSSAASCVLQQQVAFCSSKSDLAIIALRYVTMALDCDSPSGVSHAVMTSSSSREGAKRSAPRKVPSFRAWLCEQLLPRGRALIASQRRHRSRKALFTRVSDSHFFSRDRL